jgi:hypothetical protein
MSPLTTVASISRWSRLSERRKLAHVQVIVEPAGSAGDLKVGHEYLEDARHYPPYRRLFHATMILRRPRVSSEATVRMRAVTLPSSRRR